MPAAQPTDDDFEDNDPGEAEDVNDTNGNTGGMGQPFNYGQLFGGAGAGLKVGAGIGQAIGAWASGRANKMIDDFNANIEDQKATAALNQGMFSSNQMSRRITGTIAGQQVGTAANGIKVNAGTAASVTKSTLGIGSGDMAQIRANAAMRAWGYTSEANSDRLRGDLAEDSGRSQAIGDAIGTAGSAADDLYRFG